VRTDLNAHRPGLADEFERTLAEHVRPCVAITSKRVANWPLRRSLLTSALGAQTAAPSLERLASKFGGLPYAETDELWEGWRFLGQIDLEEASAVLGTDAPKLRGLLRLDLGDGVLGSRSVLNVRARWFPQPSVERAADVQPASVGAWETRLEFARAWTLPAGDAMNALWPLHDWAWLDYTTFNPDGYNGDSHNEFHRLLGHRTVSPEQLSVATPLPPGETLSDFEPLLRLTFDNQAGFSWGTNWLYLLVPGNELARGDLSRVVVAHANC
jgi:hypothetical protein